MECLLSFENSPDTESVPIAFKFLRDFVNMWDDDCALICCFRRMVIASGWVHNGGYEFLQVFTEHQIHILCS
jgi:hypothetical protein